MNQHLVSRFLLRRWANHRNGPVSALDLDTLQERTAAVEELGSMHDLVATGTAALEQAWSQKVEGKLKRAFELIDAGQILDPRNVAHLELIKKCMALHWARSFALTVILRGLMPNAVNSIVNGVLRQYTPTQAVHAMTGLYVTGFDAKDVFQRLVYDQLDAELRQNFLREQFLHHYREAYGRMSGFSLEVGHASASEFVLTDCPVVTWDKDRRISGVLYGAAWTDADAIFMAVGPKHIVALSHTGRYRELSEGQVVEMNKRQVEAAYREIYFRPGCDVGERIAEALRGSTRAH